MNPKVCDLQLAVLSESGATFKRDILTKDILPIICVH
jgi:hypothetical protein